MKKWEILKISSEYEHILEFTYALAHLPSQLMSEGVQYITGLIDALGEDSHERPKLQNFGSYIRSYWLPLSEVVSVFKKPVRTNNTCENFHLHAGRKLGHRPPTWKMLSKYHLDKF